MNRELGRGTLQGAAEVRVKGRIHPRREPRLDAHLGRPEIARLDGSPHDLFDREKVRLVRPLRPRERAEAARLYAGVGEVDVAVDDVRRDIARLIAPERVGHRDQRAEVGPLRAVEDEPALDVDLAQLQGPLEHRTNGRVGFAKSCVEAHAALASTTRARVAPTGARRASSRNSRRAMYAS